MHMLKKCFAAILALTFIFALCPAAFAAGGTVTVELMDMTEETVTLGFYVDQSSSSRLVFTYNPETATLISATGCLTEEQGITDLDTTQTGTVSFAWAAYRELSDTLVLEITLQGEGRQTATLSLPETGEEIELGVPFPYWFTDVDPEKWYTEPVYMAYYLGLMNGVGDHRFAPNSPVTRATMATVLYRIAGSPEVTGDNPFSDVKAEQWYTDAVVWASQQGIAEGYGDGRFLPGRDISRQEMATMLLRFWLAAGEEAGNLSDLSGYRDANEVASWAWDGMAWAVGNGVINGVDAGRLNPKGNATRAQLAKVLVNLLVPETV